MCGIAAIFAYHNGSGADRAELRRMTDRMTTRGPDGSGEWFSGDSCVGMGHRRLAIIDTSETGAQPMRSADGRYVIVFNGEIYNYRELRDGLRSRGWSARSTSDTEVLLGLFAEKGEAMLGDLRGMYAFSIWDEKERRMFLARDPFGIKPLYYADDGRSFRAASQVKALLAGGAVSRAPEPAGTAGFFLWGFVPEPYTLFRDIRSLPAGSFLFVDSDGGKRSSVFCSIAQVFREAASGPAGLQHRDARELLRTALLESVRHHLVSDVPVGLFLSSGLDSATLAALASELGGTPLRTMTLGFREYRGTAYDETVLSEQVARQCGTAHRTVWVSQDDFRNRMDDLIDAMDQPSFDGINSYFISRAAHETGLKVALSGLGGDELFGGYPSFSQIPGAVRFLGLLGRVPGAGKAFRALSAPLFKRVTSPKYAGVLEYGASYPGAYLLRRGLFMPWELPEVMGEDEAEEGWEKLRTLESLGQAIDGVEGGFPKVAALETMWYMRNQLLRDADWAGMAHSLEIRVPLVDVNLLRTVASISAGRASSLRKNDMAATPRTPLPEAILNRKKTGFTVPVREWLKGSPGIAGQRGLRGWTQHVYDRFVAGNA